MKGLLSERICHFFIMIFKFWRLYLSNLSGFLSYLCAGAVMAYPSPAFPMIRFDSKPLSPSMTSWLASFSGLFAIKGCVLVFPLMDKYGRKLTMITTSVVMSVGWLLQVCTYNIATLAVSRAITGLGMGMVFGCLFVYIAEISPKEQRGIIATTTSIFVGLGAILVNLLGNFINWRWIALVCLLISVAAAATSIFIYETPRWLISKGKRTMAIEVMQRLWVIDEEQLIKEAEYIEINVKLINSRNYFHILIQIFKPPLCKPLLISQLLIAFHQLSGYGYITSYTVSIFNEASVNANSTQKVLFDNPYYQSTLVKLFFVIASVLSIFVIDRFGRRVLLISNTVALAISLMAIGVYYYLKQSPIVFDFRYLHWIPVTSLLVCNFCTGAGLMAIPYLLLSELFPQSTRVVASSLGMVSRNFFSFLVTKVFATTNILPTFEIFWVFTGCSLLGLIFIVLFVPETKGRSLEEIQALWYSKNTPKIIN